MPLRARSYLFAMSTAILLVSAVSTVLATVVLPQTQPVFTAERSFTLGE